MGGSVPPLTAAVTSSQPDHPQRHSSVTLDADNHSSVTLGGDQVARIRQRLAF
jgi:hypothetical protein